MMREFSLIANQIALNLVENDVDGAPILLLHGFSNRWQVFRSILPALPRACRVASFDFRGHGKSSRAPGGYTAAGFYADADAALCHFATPAKPALVIGHSMGGSLALHLAQNHPDKVAAVIAGDASLDLAFHIDVMNAKRQTKLFGLRRKLAGRPLEELIRRGLPPEQAEEMSMLDPAVMDYHAEGRVQEFFVGVDNVDFAHIHCPVLVTQANPAKGGLLHDEEIPAGLLERPNIHFMRFDTGHDLQIEKGQNSPFWRAALAWRELPPVFQS
jgi:pimeloyl-ACP methyl ester carboxylesterase